MEDYGTNKEKKGKKRPIKKTPIDHTYCDHSTLALSALLPEQIIPSRITFPMKLHSIISNPEYKHIICWMPHGRSWKVLNKELLASVVCKGNFNHDSFESFTRSVNGWGFKVSGMESESDPSKS